VDAIKGIFKGGRLELETPPDWPDGTEVLIEPTGTPFDKIGLDEWRWRDDAAGLADWEAWIKSIEPLEFTAEEEARIAAFEAQMRLYNIQAVRRQMAEGACE
jgi:hypothetical protein